MSRGVQVDDQKKLLGVLEATVPSAQCKLQYYSDYCEYSCVLCCTCDWAVEIGIDTNAIASDMYSPYKIPSNAVPHKWDWATFRVDISQSRPPPRNKEKSSRALSSAALSRYRSTRIHTSCAQPSTTSAASQNIAGPFNQWEGGALVAASIVWS